MPVLKGKELRVVGFLCNWCSYGGADTAGVGRFSQPTDLRIVRVPCSGRVDPLFIIKALISGADGVLVSGCHPRDCHYSHGNFYARRRLETLKSFLPALGIDPERFQYTWVSASEGQRWKNVVSTFVEKVHQLGHAPHIEDAVPYLPLAAAGDALRAPLRPLAYPPAGSLAQSLERLRERIRAALPELDCVIGWQQGYDALHATPLFMRKPEDVDKLTWGPLNVHNLATYLPQFKNRKVGVVVKGCDSRSVIELLQEKLIEPDNVRVFGMPCEGVVDVAQVQKALGADDGGDHAGTAPASMSVEGDVLTVTGATPAQLKLADVVAEKCRTCDTPSPLLGDVVEGVASAPAGAPPAAPPGLEALDAMTPEQRRGFWRAQMERCLRCYACRNACPMCVCRDQCIGESRDPHWTTQEGNVREKLQFQIIHALHLAGRCTECGECQRACPVNIPVLALKQWMNRSVRDLFDYRAGMDVEAVPPLLSFAVEEKNIKEHGL